MGTPHLGTLVPISLVIWGRGAGADPDIEEGGAYIEWGWCGHVACAASAVFCACVITQSVVGRSGGELPQKNF